MAGLTGVQGASVRRPNRSREVRPSRNLFFIISLSPLSPVGLDHGRQIGDPTLLVPLAPAGLTRTRALGTIAVGAVLRMASLTHTRGVSQPGVASTVPTPVTPATDNNAYRSLRGVARRAGQGIDRD